MRLYVNGRFLTQPVSGVQRYARELLSALDDRLDDPVEVLVPREVDVPAWRTLVPRCVPGQRGHLWEQSALLRASRDGLLLSLGNSGPLRHPAHILCLHDANIYDIPAAFSPRYRLLHKALRPALARRAAALITVSAYSATRLARHLKIPEERFEIVSNAAEHVRTWPRQDGVPDRYGLDPGGYYLTVGNQSPNKNIARLVQAHQSAGAPLPPLAIVGGAAPGVAHAASGPGVRSLGRVPDEDLRGLYEGAAAFVFPSLFEGFGIPPLEAMELGLPVLCARAGAMPEVLGSAPLWFDPQSVDDMSRAMREFSALSSAARGAMIEAGRQRARAYRWAKSAKRLEVILDKVALGRAGTRIAA